MDNNYTFSSSRKCADSILGDFSNEILHVEYFVSKIRKHKDGRSRADGVSAGKGDPTL